MLPWAGEEGKGDPLLPLLLLLVVLARLVWLPLRAAAEAGELLLPFRLLRLFFPPPCPKVGGVKLEALISHLLWHTETCWGLSKRQLSTIVYPLDLHGALIQDIYLKPATSSLDSFFSVDFLYVAAVVLGPV